MEKLVIYDRLVSDDYKDVDELFASAWVKHYKNDSDGAFRDIIHLTFMMAGLNPEISLDAITEDGLYVMVEEVKLQLVTMYKDISNLKIPQNMVINAGNLIKLIAFNGTHFFLRNTSLRNHLLPVLGFLIQLGVFSLRHSATIVATSIITGLIEKQAIGAFNFVKKVLKDVEEVFYNRWKDTNSVIRVYVMDKLNIWIDKKPDQFIRNKYIKRVAWLLHDRCSAVLVSALNVALNVFSHPSYYHRIREFVESISIVIPRLILLPYPVVVEKITEIYVIFSRHFPSQISSDDIEAVTSVLLTSENELCSRATIPFFMTYVIGDGTTNEKIQNLVRFTCLLKFKSSTPVLIHTIFDNGKYGFITDWYAMINTLLNSKLTDEERLQLVYIMNLSAEKAFVQGATPMMLMSKMTQSEKFSLKYEKAFTSVFMNNISKLLSLELKEEHYAQLIYGIEFTNPELINEKSLDYNFINLITKHFNSSTYEPLMQSSTRTLHALSLVESKKELSSKCKEQLSILCNSYKEQSMSIVSDFVEDMEEYFNSEEKQLEILRILKRNRNLLPVADKNDLSWVYKTLSKLLEDDMDISSFSLNLVEECLTGIFAYFKAEFEFIEKLSNDKFKEVSGYLKMHMKVLIALSKPFIFHRHGQVIFCSFTLIGNKLSTIPQAQDSVRRLFSENILEYLNNYIRYCVFEEKGRKVNYNMCRLFKRTALSEYLSLVEIAVIPIKVVKYVFVNAYKNIDLFVEPLIERILPIHNQDVVVFECMVIQTLLEVFQSMEVFRNIRSSADTEQILDELENVRVIAFTINLALYPHREFIQDTILKIHRDILNYIYKKKIEYEPLIIALAELLYCVDSQENRKMLLEFVDQQENPSKSLKYYRLQLTSNVKFNGKFLRRLKTNRKKPPRDIDIRETLNSVLQAVTANQERYIDFSRQRSPLEVQETNDQEERIEEVD